MAPLLYHGPRFRDVTRREVRSSQTKEEIARPADLERLAHVADLIPPGMRSLLDVGTKTGYFCSIAQSAGFDAIGLDDTIREGIVPGVTFVRGDIRALPFADDSFDCVTAFEILEHLAWADVQRAAAELRRVARRCVIVSVPYREYPIRTANHLQNFTKRKLSRIFGRSVRFHFYGHVATKPTVVAKVLNRGIRLVGASAHFGWWRPQWVIAISECSSGIADRDRA